MHIASLSPEDGEVDGCEETCKEVWRSACSYMKWQAFCEKYNGDDDFRKLVDQAELVMLRKAKYAGYQASVNRVASARIESRKQAIGLTREQFKREFGMFPEAVGLKIRSIQDVDGSQFQGVLVLLPTQKSGRLFDIVCATGYDFQEHLMKPDETLHNDQGEQTFSVGKSSDKKFSEQATMCRNALSWEDSLSQTILYKF